MDHRRQQYENKFLRWPPTRRRTKTQTIYKMLKKIFSVLYVQICQNYNYLLVRKPNNDFLLKLFIFLMLLIRTNAICPSKCKCNDKNLEATCIFSNLEIVPIQLNPEVRKLILNNNKISNIELTLTFYMNLQYLDLSYNRINSLGSKNFESQVILLYLNLSNNNISKIGKDTFRGLKNIKIIDLSSNTIEEVNERSGILNLTTLQELVLTGNMLTTLDALNLNLKILNLNFNQFLSPPKVIEDLRELQELDLSWNLIDSINISFPHNLQILKLQSNILSYIHNDTFNNLLFLEYLDLSDNNITAIPTFQLSKLQNLLFLNLSSNLFSHLKPISFHGLFKLKELYLNYLPNLFKIDARTFIDNINLNILSVRHNLNLKYLPFKLLKSNIKLKHIYLDANSFSTLDPTDLQLDYVETLRIGRNPFVCNCSLLWLYVLKENQNTTCWPTCVNDLQPTILDLDDIYCEEPKRLKNIRFSSLSRSNFDCDRTWLIYLLITLIIVLVFSIVLIVFIRFKFCVVKSANKTVEDYIEATKNYENKNHTYYNFPKENMYSINDKTLNMYISTPMLHNKNDLYVDNKFKMNNFDGSSCSNVDFSKSDIHIYQEPFTGPMLNNTRSPHIVYV